MRVLFRVDGSTKQGMGHVVRVGALALSLSARDVSGVFLTAEDAGHRWLAAHGHAVELVGAEPGSLADAQQVAETAAASGCEWIVTDGRDFREPYLEALTRTGLPVVAIDDLAEWPFPTAMIVNGSLPATRLAYQTSPETRLLLGPDYLLLRPEFRRRWVPRRAVRRVFACFGGADPDDYSAVALRAWRRIAHPERLDIVVGPAYPYGDQLRAAAPPSVVIHENVGAASLAELMSEADLAVASAGMVACELAALGVPLLALVISADQHGNAAVLTESGAAHLVDPPTEHRLAMVLRKMIDDTAALHAMAERARQLVDGNGAERVADAILRLRRPHGGRRTN